MLLRIFYFAIPLCLIVSMVAATELPVPRTDRQKAAAQKKFERHLLSPIGKGRLE